VLRSAVDFTDISLARQADRVIAISPVLRDVLIDKGVPAERIDVIPGGVDLAKFRSAAPFSFADEWGWHGQVIGYVSSIGRGRNSDTLVRAFKRVVDVYPEPVYLAMIGPVRQMEYFEALVQELGLQERVKFPGFMPHAIVPSLVKGFDVAVSIYPPNQQLFDQVRVPYKVLEYMGAGAALLVCNNVCHTNIVTHMQDALVVEPSEEEIAQGLLQLLENPDLRARLGANAQKSSEYYEFANIAELIKQSYAAVLGHVAPR
jgi:glycosyltransferase involved in cell wall biosynthesis